MRRNGKIAQLPHYLREEINQRLYDGVTGKKVAAWLNDLPLVHQHLHGKYEQTRITESNVSEWRLGGYKDWKKTREIKESVGRLLGCPKGMIEAVQSGLVDQMAVALASHMLAHLQQLPLVEDESERTRQWREMRSTLDTMRRYELHSKRLQILQEQAGIKDGLDAEDIEPPLTDEEKQKQMRQILGLSEASFDAALGKYVGPGAELENIRLEVDRRVRAEFAARRAGEDAEKRKQSKQIGPDGSESGQIEVKPENKLLSPVTIKENRAI